MSSKWLNVTAFYGSDQARKNAFEEICLDVLQKHYHGYFIESFKMDNSLSDISIRSSPNEKRIVFHTRFYTDELTNARKQRIRKAFYYSTDMYAKVNVPFLKWILCIPGTLSEDDKLWWTNFKTRSTISSAFDLEILDGDALIDLINKYEIHTDWFNKMVPIKKGVKKQSTTIENVSEIIGSNEQVSSPTEVNPSNTKKDEIDYMDLFIDEKDIDFGSMLDENTGITEKEGPKTGNTISTLINKISASFQKSGLTKSLNPGNIEENLDSSKNTRSKGKRKKIIIIAGISLLSVLVISVIAYFTLIPPTQEMGKPALKIYERQMMIGNNYARRINPQYAQYYDSAIIAYKSVLFCNPRFGLAARRMNAVRKAKENYRATIEKNIKNDSNKYFVSLRKPSEGLRLFKYLYDPSNRNKGKYGFIDNSGKVAILPVFDFNYKKMKDAGETFQNGRAKVCIVNSLQDTSYFYINKRGERINE